MLVRLPKTLNDGLTLKTLGKLIKKYRFVWSRIVDELGDKVPETLEAAVCILSQYFGSNIRLFNDNPRTYTRCKDKVQGFQTAVGGFTTIGLAVDMSYGFEEDLGVAALRKF